MCFMSLMKLGYMNITMQRGINASKLLYQYSNIVIRFLYLINFIQINIVILLRNEVMFVFQYHKPMHVSQYIYKILHLLIVLIITIP